MAAVIALGPFSLDAYLPSFPYIASDLGVSSVAVGYSLSAYLFGMSLGQLLGGPVSDQIGRRKIAITGLTLFFCASVLILFVQQLEWLIVARVFQAIGGGFASAVVLPSIRDLSRPEKVASRLAMVFLIMLVAPLVAPLLGVTLLHLGWRWIFGFLSLYALVLLVIYLFFLSETRGELSTRINFGKIISQYHSVIHYRLEGTRTPIFYGLAASLSNCIMLIYVTNASFIFQTYFGVPDALFPLFFGANVVALALVQSFSARYLRNRDLSQVAAYFRFGQRLQLVLLCCLVLAVLFSDITLWLFVPLILLTLSCLGINGSSGSGLFLSAFGNHSGSASALLTTGTFLFGALLGGVSAILNRGDLLSVVGVMLIASLSANLLLTTVSRTREKSVLAKVQSGEIAAF